MKLEPRLIDVAVPAHPQGVVLVLHGGANRPGRPRVSLAQPSVLRMAPIAGKLARAARGRLAVFRLLNSRRGWDTTHTPTQDVRWALDRLASDFGGALPTCLVGHSLGGRAALLSADRQELRGVVALAPWVHATDVPRGSIDCPVMIVHGSRDSVARPERSAALARALATRTAVGYVTVAGATHAMLHRHRIFSGLAVDFTLATLLDTPVDGVVAQVLAGERWVEL